MNYLMFLMLKISPATQSDSLFIASDSLFDEIDIIDFDIIDGWHFHSGERLSNKHSGTVY